MAWLDLNTVLFWTLPTALSNAEFESFILVYSCPISSLSLPVCSVCSGFFLSCSSGFFQGVPVDLPCPEKKTKLHFMLIRTVCTDCQ